MSRGKYGRHLPAFVLLFLAFEPAYGAILLNKFREHMINVNIDGAAIYRVLQELENSKAVESYWDTSEPGPAKKWYKITNQGLKILADYKEDIVMRKKNLEFFLNTFEVLDKN